MLFRSGISDNAKAVEVLTELQNLPHETHDVGYGLNNAQSYNYKTGIFTSDAGQAIDYVVRRMRRKEDVPTEIPAALKKAVADSYGMVDNLIDGMSSTKVWAAKKETSASDKRTDTAATSLEGDTALSQTEGSAAKIDNSSETAKENGEKVDVEAPKTFDEFLNHPSLKFSIKNEQQRKAAEDAYEYASKLRPNKSSQYALVDMSNPSSSPDRKSVV